MISHDDDSLSLFAPYDVEDDLQREELGPLREVLFLVNNREAQSEGHTKGLRKYCARRQKLNNDKLYDPKINPNFGNTIDEVWGKKLTEAKLKIRLHKRLKTEKCAQL